MTACRWLVLLSAAIAAVLVAVLPAAPASAATVSAAGTRVGASHPATILAVGVSHPVTADQGRCGLAPEPGIVVGACVAPEDTGADLPELSASRSQLEAKFYHAPDFGVTESRGAAGFDAYGKAVNSFINDSSTVRTLGTYRGDPAILNYNPDSGLVVVQAPSGEFISGWQASEQQLWNVMNRGSLGGG